jgi:type II secretory pathway component PulJ
MSTDEMRPTAERMEEIERMGEALRRAVRQALLRHKRAGNPVAVWRDGRVQWIAPDDIPVAEAEKTT